jgi:hypothetical protein
LSITIGLSAAMVAPQIPIVLSDNANQNLLQNQLNEAFNGNLSTYNNANIGNFPMTTTPTANEVLTKFVAYVNSQGIDDISINQLTINGTITNTQATITPIS